MTDTPTLWRDMTPEEKGALLLGWQQGKVIEFYVEDGYWLTTECEPHWGRHAYRIKPEPKLETVVLYGGEQCLWDFEGRAAGVMHKTHKITFNLIDGKPDPASIKMEML